MFRRRRPLQPPISFQPPISLEQEVFDDCGLLEPMEQCIRGVVFGMENRGEECYAIAPLHMVLAQPGIGRIIHDHQCMMHCEGLGPCLTAALKPAVAAMLEGHTTIETVAATLQWSVSRQGGRLSSDDAGSVLQEMMMKLAVENGLEAVGLQRMIFCLGCSPDAPLSTRNEGGDSVYPVPSTDAHDAPYLTLEASLRGYLAEEAIQFQHACQSLRCARITQFKEVPTHLHLVIQRASEAGARLSCPLRLDISEHCASGGRAVLLLNAAVLFRHPGHYMTIVRSHGQQQGRWIGYNDKLSYWMPDALVKRIMKEGLLAYAVQYVQEGPDMSSHLELLRTNTAPIVHSSDLGGAKLQQQFEGEAATVVFRAAMRRLLQDEALRGLRGYLRQVNRGAVMPESELADLLGALSASPEVRLAPAEVQQHVQAAFEAAQKQTFSWAGTARYQDSAGAEAPAGSHYSSSSSAAELPGSPFQQPSPSASLHGLAPAAGGEDLPQAVRTVFTAAMGKLLQENALRGLHGYLRQVNSGADMPESEVADCLAAFSGEAELEPAAVRRQVHKAFEAAQQEAAHLPSSSAFSAASAAAASFSSGKVPLQPLQRGDSGVSTSPIAALCRGQDAFQGFPCNMEPAPPVPAPSGASTVGRQDSAGVGSPASSYHSSGSAAQLLGSLSRQLSPPAMQLYPGAAHADAAPPGSSAVLAGEASTWDQVHLEANTMAQMQAGLGLPPASAAAPADWRHSWSPSFSCSVQDDSWEADSLGTAWGGIGMGSQAADSGVGSSADAEEELGESSMCSQASDSDVGSAGDAEEELGESPGNDNFSGARGRDHWTTEPENRSLLAGAVRPSIIELPESQTDEGHAERPHSPCPVVEAEVPAVTRPCVGPHQQQSGSDAARSAVRAASQLTAAEVLEASGVETDRYSVNELAGSLDEEGQEWLRSSSPVLDIEAPHGAGAGAVVEDVHPNADSAQAVPRAVPQLRSEEKEGGDLQKGTGMAPVRRNEEVGQTDGDAASVERVLQAPRVQQEPIAPPGAAAVMAGDGAEEAAPRAAVRPAPEAKEGAAAGPASSYADTAENPMTLMQPASGSADSTSAAAEGPKLQAGSGSQPAAEAALPSPAQWAAEGTKRTSVGSTAGEEPVQRMQPASDLAGSSAEADGMAAAGDQPRGSREDMTMRLDGSTAAQPVAVLEPDVRSLEDADVSLQEQLGTYAEAEAAAPGVMEPILADVEPGSIKMQRGLEEAPADHGDETDVAASEDGGYLGDDEVDDGDDPAGPPPQPARRPQAASTPVAAKGFFARTAEAVATGAGTAAGAATIAYRLVGGAAAGIWQSTAILAGSECQAAAPAAAGGGTCLGWVAAALTCRRQACSQAAADLLGSRPRDFWAAGEAAVLGAVGAAMGVAAVPFRRADAVLRAGGAACGLLLSRVGLARRQ